MQIRYSQKVTIEGMTFSGLTTDEVKYKWGEQGLFLVALPTACQRKSFLNFGDACLRVTTADEPPLGVNSYNALIESNHLLTAPK